ncbi:L-asparaginase [Polynucleobacter meluiroseus]|uniref:L-asparaginase n=2 Tax=Polynucleobacter meluiroseus TaxID=1938814 RepID=A0A240E167_9BURK|nr:L-asparaginase [Polynucleobacter meluiroseus]
MGGTIAGLAADPEGNPNKYKAGQVGIDSLLAHIASALPQNIAVISEQLANMNSRNLSESLLTDLGNRIQECLNDLLVKGIVITHGTDTMEETGLFLQATCGHRAQILGKRIVITGAMLPANAPAADGPRNLVDAISWASMPLENCPNGVYAVMSGKVCLAMDLAKRHGSALNAPLRDSPTSPVNLINPSWLSCVKAVQAAWGEDLPIPKAEEWPWVEILTSHAGARARTIKHWLTSEVLGLVLAGTGAGGFHDDWSEPLDEAIDRGIALVRTSRTGSGATYPHIPEKDAHGCMASGTLSAPRARIALQLALNAAETLKISGKALTWQDFFARIANLPEFR